MTVRRDMAGWAGMIGSALFVGVFTIEGYLRPGYDQFREYVSALSLGPRGWIQIANFVVVGLLLLWFARGVIVEWRPRNASRTGPVLLTIIAIGLLLSGPFVMDQPGARTVHGTLHGIFGAVVFTLMPIDCFLFLRRFRGNARWQSFCPWTALAGTIVATAVVVLSSVSKLPPMTHRFSAWLGLIQRAALIPYMCWVFAFALRFRRGHISVA